MIRLATRYDIPRLLEIVEAYAYENPIKCLGKSHNHFPKYVEELLFSIIAGRGFIYIDNNMRGAIIAIKQSNVWSPKVKELNELQYRVTQEEGTEAVTEDLRAIPGSELLCGSRHSVTQPWAQVQRVCASTSKRGNSTLSSSLICSRRLAQRSAVPW